MDAVIYHKTVVSIYERYQEGSTYRSGDTSVGFEHKNLKFINYDHVFDSGLQIKEGEAIGPVSIVGSFLTLSSHLTASS